jgi:hypothetical protein
MTSMVLLKPGKKPIGLLYTFPRRLFGRTWQAKLSRLSQHLFFDLVRELSDTHHIGLITECKSIFVMQSVLYAAEYGKQF